MGFIVDVVLPIALAFIMFSLGLGLTAQDFIRVARQPRDFALGAICQVVLLPAVAFVLVVVWQPPPALALGVMIMAAAPGGPTSNLLTHFARGDVALSISLTAIVSSICVLTIPPIVVFASSCLQGDGTEETIPLGATAARLFIMITVPVLLGLLLRRFATGFAVRFEPIAVKISGVIFVLVLAAAIFKERDNLVSYFVQSGSITLALILVMMTLAFVLARLFATGPRQSVAISLECGIQNGVLAIAVATTLFGGGLTLVPAITYGLTMYVPALALVAYFRWRSNRAL
jgi:BASS family bile acid:Na+ symporter